ncbi:MAG: hypothetical protein U1F65_02925 [Verrucomicrobiota bacterium]
MTRPVTLAILSDIHHACPAEQSRGDDYELVGVKNPLLHLFLKAHHRWFWLHRQLHHNPLLDRFLDQAGTPDLVVANGDYSCDTGFCGVSDDAAYESARTVLTRLRERFSDGFHATFGDHELGKRGFVNGTGGMRLASYHRARQELGLQPFWTLTLGRYVLIGVTSTLIALPVFAGESLPEEFSGWQRLREEHLRDIRQTFASLRPEQRVLLFCHDPTALPFLGREPEIAARLGQIEQTIIGHLHSQFILSLSWKLAGLPTIGFLGSSVRRMSTALGEARHWKPFNVRLCPSLTGIELFKDGGFLTAEVDPEGNAPVKFRRHRLPR